ncbi:hypothetical protein [Halalkalibacter lacteus]|uniref:hypothetical protein n=1 Tax=Halalkalibacter lacteus TaxID=3090663 RepID=UPI002FC85C5B
MSEKNNKLSAEKKQQPKYKSVRIHPEDFQEYKRLSYFQDKPIVDLISEALELLKKKYDE